MTPFSSHSSVFTRAQLCRNWRVRLEPPQAARSSCFIRHQYYGDFIEKVQTARALQSRCQCIHACTGTQRAWERIPAPSELCPEATMCPPSSSFTLLSFTLLLVRGKHNDRHLTGKVVLKSSYKVCKALSWSINSNFYSHNDHTLLWLIILSCQDQIK